MIAALPAVEHYAVNEVFVSGLCRIESVGAHNARLTYYVDQTDMEGRPERVVVLKVIIAMDGFAEARAQIGTFIAKHRPSMMKAMQ